MLSKHLRTIQMKTKTKKDIPSMLNFQVLLKHYRVILNSKIYSNKKIKSTKLLSQKFHSLPLFSSASYITVFLTIVNRNKQSQILKNDMINSVFTNLTSFQGSNSFIESSIKSPLFISHQIPILTCPVFINDTINTLAPGKKIKNHLEFYPLPIDSS